MCMHTCAYVRVLSSHYFGEGGFEWACLSVSSAENVTSLCKVYSENMGRLQDVLREKSLRSESWSVAGGGLCCNMCGTTLEEVHTCSHWLLCVSAVYREWSSHSQRKCSVLCWLGFCVVGVLCFLQFPSLLVWNGGWIMFLVPAIWRCVCVCVRACVPKHVYVYWLCCVL